MRKFKFFLLAITGAAVLMLGGCKEKAKYDESAFQDDLEPLTDDELESMDENTDDEMTVADEDEMAQGDLEADETKIKRAVPMLPQTVQRARRSWMRKALILIRMMWLNIFMNMDMFHQI